MKIKLESEKIIKAVKKLDGIDLVLEDPEDAKEAIQLLLGKDELFGGDDSALLKDVGVKSYREYKTSAVDYRMIFLLDFSFEEDTSSDTKVAIINKFQSFFEKV